MQSYIERELKNNFRIFQLPWNSIMHKGSANNADSFYRKTWSVQNDSCEDSGAEGSMMGSKLDMNEGVSWMPHEKSDGATA